MAIHPTVVEIFHKKTEMSTSGWNYKGLQKLLGFIICEPTLNLSRTFENNPSNRDLSYYISA